MPISAPTEVVVERVFRALSDKTRLRLLNLLQRGELRVSDLVNVLAIPQSATSRHLAYLRLAGLVLTRRDGPWMHYRLVAEQNSFHSMIMQCVSRCAELIPQLAEDLQRLDRSGATPTI